MANIASILDYCKAAATANSYDYLIASSISDINKATSRRYPLIMIVPPSTTAPVDEMANHSFTVFVLNRLKNSKEDTLRQSNDRYHEAYKLLDDAFYAWLASVEGQGTGTEILVPLGEDIEIERLRDRRTQDELIGIQVSITFRTQWYCGTDAPNLPSGGGSCADATVLNADGSSYLTVASGGSVQLTGFELSGNTAASGTFNDGTGYEVSGFQLSGKTASSGTFNDGGSYVVSGVTISGNTSATGVELDGATFTVSGVTVNDDGTSTTYDDGTTVNIFRNGWSVLLDGVNQYAAVTGVTDFNFEYADAFSVEFWVRNDGLSFAPYVANFDTSPLNGWRVTRSGTGSHRGGIEFVIADGSINYRVSTNSTSLLTAGLWHHVVVCKPANNVAANAKIYVDGVSVAFTVGATGGTGAITHNDGLWVGTNSDLAGGKLDANFDSLVVYNRELSAGEALDHYNNGRPDDRSGDSGLVGYWRFENDFTDETASSNDLTGFNSPTFSRQRP